jgi:hypothetical protein
MSARTKVKNQKILPLRTQSNHRQILILCVLALFGTLIIYSPIRKSGIGMSPDSISYISASQSLLAGEGFINLNGLPFVHWPPLYPVVLTFFKLFGMNYALTMTLMNFLFFITTILLSSLLIKKQTGSFAFAIMLAAFCIFSKPLFYVWTFAWSEPFFIMIIVSFFYCLHTYMKQPSFRNIVILALITISTTLARYPGIVMLPIFGLYIFLNTKTNFIKRSFYAIMWTIIAAMPLILWIARNILLTGTPFGERWKDVKSFYDTTVLYGKIINSWFLPSFLANLPGIVTVIIISFCIITVFAFSIYKIWKNKIISLSVPAAMVMFIILYSFMMIHTTTSIYITGLDDRYLSPIFIPLVFIILLIVHRSLKLRLFQMNFAPVSLIIIGLCFLSTMNNFSDAVKIIQYRQIENYDKLEYNRSELFDWLNKNKLEGRFYSNLPSAIYYKTRCRSDVPPYNFMNNEASLEVTKKIRDESIENMLKAINSSKPTYLIWKIPHHQRNMYTINQIQQFCRMQVVKECSDGIIIRLLPY